MVLRMPSFLPALNLKGGSCHCQTNVLGFVTQNYETNWESERLKGFHALVGHKGSGQGRLLKIKQQDVCAGAAERGRGCCEEIHTLLATCVCSRNESKDLLLV